MKTKKIPMRTCVVTHETCDKKDLIRIVKSKDGNIILDDTYKANGRGAYLKRDKDVVLKAKHSRILDKHLDTKVPDFIYEEILKNI